MSRSNMSGPIETEVKIRVPQPDALIPRIHSAGYQESVPRVFEANTIYDTKKKDLNSAGMLLRLRQAGEKKIITWKGPEQPGPHKSRPETETGVLSLETMHQILGHLGFEPTFRYEKYRTEFSAGDHGRTITIDETPIGHFIELEGDPGWIDSTASQLGFSNQDYILDSYGRLYLLDCERRGVQPANMVFTSNSR